MEVERKELGATSRWRSRKRDRRTGRREGGGGGRKRGEVIEEEEWARVRSVID